MKDLFNNLIRAERDLKNAQEGLGMVSARKAELEQEFGKIDTNNNLVNIENYAVYRGWCDIEKDSISEVFAKQKALEDVQADVADYENQKKVEWPHSLSIPAKSNGMFSGYGWKHKDQPFHVTDPSNRIKRIHYLEPIAEDEDKNFQHYKYHDRTYKNSKLSRISRNRKRYQSHKWDNLFAEDIEIKKAKKLKKISVRNLFGYHSYAIKLNDGMSIFYGSNGLGKTTILNIVGYLLSEQNPKAFIMDFNNIPFELIKLEFDEAETEIVVEKSNHNLTITLSNEENRISFNINSIASVEEYYSSIGDFIECRSVCIKPYISADLAAIGFNIREDDEKFKGLQKAFEDVVYYEGDPSRKKLVIKNREVRLLVNKGSNFDFSKDEPLYILSDGERNALCIIYNFIYNFDENTIILMDEPEKSLHVDLQEDLSRRINKFVKEKNGQVFFVSHSPFMLSGNSDAFVSADCIKD